jgi:hypothetical protein
VYLGRNQARPTAVAIRDGSQRISAETKRGRRQSQYATGPSVFRPKPSEADGERPEPTSRRRGRSTSGSRRDRPKDVIGRRSSLDSRESRSLPFPWELR